MFFEKYMSNKVKYEYFYNYHTNELYQHTDLFTVKKVGCNGPLNKNGDENTFRM